MNRPLTFVACLLLLVLSTVSSATFSTNLFAADNEALPLKITSDVVYGHKAGMALTYDVIQRSDETNGATVAFMMSGGWVSSWMDPNAIVGPQVPFGFRHFRELVAKGYTLVIVRHGSSPYFKVPDAVDDVHKAIGHLKLQADRFAIDVDRIGICGASAGGHLSLMLGCAPDLDQPAAEVTGEGRIAAVVAYFPPVDLTAWVGPSKQFPALDFDPQKASRVSPIEYATADDPPTLLIHGDNDTLVKLENSQRMHQALTEKHVPCELIVIEGAGHGFAGDNGRRASAALVEWFDRYLLKTPAPATSN